MFLNRLFIYITVFAVGVGVSYAQRKTIRGVVKDSTNNEILAGVMVVNNTVNQRVQTNAKGEFAIMAQPKDIISFSFVGYTTLNFMASNLPKQILMSHQSEEIDEVVVIGYGTVNKKDFTGALSDVDVKDIQKAPVANIANSLAGRAAGLQVNSLSGQPGEDVDIVIRGGNSITQDNSPLYVVDGFPMEGFSLSSINPEEIAELRILKDASATAIYGSRGANGVIILETKRGSEGKPLITYNLNYSIQKPNKFMDLMNPYEFVKYQLELDPVDASQLYLTKQNRTLEDYKNIEGIDWQNAIFRTAPMQNHNLSLRGGVKGTKYSFSGNYVDQDGVLINSGFSRYQGRARIDQDINRKLKINLNLSYSKDKNYGQLNNQQASGNNSYATYIMYRIWGYRPVSTNGDLTELLFDDEDEGTGTLMIINPVTSTINEFRQQSRSIFTSNLGVEYQLPWNLKLNIRGGYTTGTVRNEFFNNSKTYRGYPGPNNANGIHGGYSDINTSDWMNENTISYLKKINKSRIDAVVGMTIQGRNMDSYGFTSIQIPNEELGMRALSNGYPKSPVANASANKLMSYLGRVNYSYDSKYLFTASFRADGSSKFSPQNRWGYFPSIAAAWALGREDFLKNITLLSDSKIRMSYGATGNNRVGDFSTNTILDFSDYYGIGGGSSIPDFAVVVSNFGNKELKWETTYQFDIGYELSLFKNRFNFTVDYYNKETKDLLLNSNVPYATGYQRIYRNIGSIRNRGFEFEVAGRILDKKDFKWNSKFNISFNTNQVLSLTEDERTMFTNVSFTGDWNASNLYMTQVGKSVSSFFGLVWDGVYQLSDFDQLSNGSYILKSDIASIYSDRTSVQPGFIKYKDINGDMIIDDRDKIVIGRTLPIHYGGFNNNFQYKNLSLNVFFQWNYGNQIMNANRLTLEGNATNRRGVNQFSSYDDRWSLDNQNSVNHKVRGSGPNGYYSSKHIEDGSFLRLKTIELAYSLPKKMIGKLNAIDLSVATQNIYTWSNYSGLDPEVSTRNSILTPGFDYSAYAQNFTVSFGARVSF